MRAKSISALFFALSLLSALFAAPDSSLNLSYEQRPTSRLVKATLRSRSIVYSVSIRQKSDGSFTLEAPPILCADLDGWLRIGEIRDARLFTLLLDPMTRTRMAIGFERGKNTMHISNPSRDPTLSGFSLSFEHLDVIALTPVLNPKSPSAIGIITGNGNLFAAYMFASRNSHRKADLGYSLDWNNLSTAKDLSLFLIGANERTAVLGADVLCSAFLQSSWDPLLGGGTAVGWDMDVESVLGRISARHRFGSEGLDLKGSGQRERPMEMFDLDLSVERDGLGLDASFSAEVYPRPVYGGQSQEMALELDLGLKWKGLSLEVDNLTSYQRDRGKMESTNVRFSAKAGKAVTEASMKLSRGSAGIGISDVELSFHDDLADLSLAYGKTSLELSWEHSQGNCRMKVSIDQDRLVKASLSFYGI